MITPRTVDCCKPRRTQPWGPSVTDLDLPGVAHCTSYLCVGGTDRRVRHSGPGSLGLNGTLQHSMSVKWLSLHLQEALSGSHPPVSCSSSGAWSLGKANSAELCQSESRVLSPVPNSSCRRPRGCLWAVLISSTRCGLDRVKALFQSSAHRGPHPSLSVRATDVLQEVHAQACVGAAQATVLSCPCKSPTRPCRETQSQKEQDFERRKNDIVVVRT